ncbi:glycosyltransferase [Virgibacillus oceani]|uniref:Glycosyl transferase n=1 Tax=Virgibacillus oceani TaxID=1479511 RepID=A0A917M4U8_9BACI|nr:glycosyltransferase [Virgibacillus oceani]GGG75507.1 glycosyl transferase [Virgibacillus oceani]
MSKNVCFLVSEHPFLDARIFKKEAKSLLKNGYNITMIVPRKNGFLFDIDGSPFKDKFTFKTFMHEGIKIITYEQVYLEKQLKSLHYTIQSKGTHRFTDPLTKLGIAQEADIYHCHEFFSLYSGIGIKRTLAAKGKSSKIIYDSHELYPDPLAVQSSKTKEATQKMLKNMLQETDYIITVSESIKSWFHSIGTPPPIEVLYNSPPLAPEYIPNQANNTGLVLAFEGILNKKRGSFPKLINIAEVCNKTIDLKIKIIGGGKHTDNDVTFKIPEHLKSKVEYTGWVNFASIPDVMKDVDLGWIDMNPVHSLNNRFAMPNKFFSYLNNGVPVLVNQCTDMEKFIEMHNCGFVIKKFQATATDYADALISLHSNRNKIRAASSNARSVMESQYSWEHMEKKLFGIYEQL